VEANEAAHTYPQEKVDASYQARDLADARSVLTANPLTTSNPQCVILLFTNTGLLPTDRMRDSSLLCSKSYYATRPDGAIQRRAPRYASSIYSTG